LTTRRTTPLVLLAQAYQDKETMAETLEILATRHKAPCLIMLAAAAVELCILVALSAEAYAGGGGGSSQTGPDGSGGIGGGGDANSSGQINTGGGAGGNAKNGGSGIVIFRVEKVLVA
jgi:hypothetical protein